MLKIVLFGSPQFILNDKVISQRLGGKPLALLCYLAASGRTAARDSVADLFWSELNNQQARNNLRYTLPELREALGDYLSVTTQTITLDPRLPRWLDVEIFRRTVGAGLETASTAELQAAVDLYQGEFLAGLRVRNAPLFEEWVTTQQEELHRLAVQGWHKLAIHYSQEDNQTAALQAIQCLLGIDPWHEAGHRLQMQLLVKGGQRSVALEQYLRLKQRFEDELKLAPAPETTALYAQLLRSTPDSQLTPVPLAQPHQPPRPSSMPPVVELPAPAPLILPQSPSLAVETSRVRHNLPRQMTSLVGREMEIVAILAKLQEPGYPLLSLLGEGGIGKTRLALTVAEKALSLFPEGVWFVPLVAVAATHDASERIAAAIGDALNLAFSGREGLTQQVMAQLRYKRLLLVLDNLEHLLDSTQFLLDLLQSAPGLKILATSRRQLDLQLEYSWALDGLSFPTLEEAAPLSERDLLRFESVSLFVERARRARPSFQFDTDNRTAVVQICQQVHGSPLAIELAATLTRQSSCHHIASELAQHFAILSTTLRDVAPHHRSIQSVLQTSWQYLSAEDAKIISRASLFRGGFTVAAAQAVMGADPEALERLISHSLLSRMYDVAGQNRYAMHELVRQFAREKLQRSPIVSQQVASLHCSYFAGFMQSQAEAIKRTTQTRRLIQADFDNVRAAWQWATENQRLDALMQSVTTLCAFYEFVGFFQEAEAVLGQTITRIRPLLPQAGNDNSERYRLLGRLLSEQTGFCVHLGDFDRAKALAQATITLGNTAGDFYVQADGYRRHGGILRDLGDVAQAKEELELALDLARNHHIPYLEALSLHNLAGIFYNQSEFQQALPLYKAGLALALQIEDRIVAAPIAHNLGSTYLVLGDYTQALHYFEQDLQTSRELGWERLAAFANMNIGYMLSALGDFVHAKPALQAALASFRNLGCRPEESNILVTLAGLQRLQGDLVQAYENCLQAIQMAEVEQDPWQQGMALAGLGEILVDLARLPEAIQAYEQALRIWQELGNLGYVTLSRALLAFALFRQGESTRAVALIDLVYPELDQLTSEGTPVFLALYQILSATQDKRATEILLRGYQFLQAQLATIEDETLRRSCQENIPVNRALLALAQPYL